MKNASTILLLSLLSTCSVFSQEFKPIYNESEVPSYELPDLLIAKEGTKISTAEKWLSLRKNEIMDDFKSLVYGGIPDAEIDVEVRKIKEIEVFGSKAIMKEVKMIFSRNNKQSSMNILIYLPKSSAKVPVFVGLNFYGNHTITDDVNVSLASGWIRNNEQYSITENKATENSRGVRNYRWPVEKILDRGYGLATIYYGDLDPDKNYFSDGIHPLFYQDGQHQPEKDEWGAIGAWAWGLSRAMDYFEQEDDIDEAKIVLMGHSRLGKTSLWAGALDDRFSIVISNNSGCGGAALSRRRFGETVGRINSSFPHWFCDNFNEFSDNEDALPVDQHMLIALIAPRPVYVASAAEDLWADPKGEFLSAFHAGEVYKLFGIKGLPSDQMPELNQPIQNSIGYHIRSGKHDVTDFDWKAYMDFADMHFGR